MDVVPGDVEMMGSRSLDESSTRCRDRGRRTSRGGNSSRYSVLNRTQLVKYEEKIQDIHNFDDPSTGTVLML